MDHYVKITLVCLNPPLRFLRLVFLLLCDLLERVESMELSCIFLEEVKLPKPWRLTLQDQSGRPGVGLFLILWAGKAIDIYAMLGDEDKIVEIALDEFRFILRPNRVLCLLYLEFGSVQVGQFRNLQQREGPRDI